MPPGWDYRVSFVENERNEGGAYFDYSLSTITVDYGHEAED